jgi:hypothetical protein
MRTVTQSPCVFWTLWYLLPHTVVSPVSLVHRCLSSLLSIFPLSLLLDVQQRWVLATMGEPYEATPPSAPHSYPEPQIISPHITLQAPLSRRGKGPGLILVLDHYALIEKSEKHLDPPPLQKWAEEGFAVIQLLVPGKVEDGGEFPLQKVLELLRGCKGCEFERGVGMICKCNIYVLQLHSISRHIISIRSGRTWVMAQNRKRRDQLIP